MENRQDAAWREAIACLPETRAAMLREIAMQDKIEELRLRCGEAPGVRTGGREQTLALPPVTADELRETVSRASRYSLHSCAESMKNGFLPLAGGHRLGLCGTAVTENGAVTGVRRISSLNLRVARQIETIDRILLPFAAENPLLSLLVLAPPGCGKTTLVRAWVRLVSDAGHTVAVADERGEIAGLFEGVPQFRVGRHTDILEGCTKKQAALSMGGNAVTATALQAATMLVFDLVLRLTESLLVPAVCVYLAVTVVDAAAGNGMLRGLADGVGSLTAGALKLMLTLFTAYLAVAGGVSGNVDRLALKTAKFAVSGAVPVVGGVMSDAAETVLSGASLLRGSVGVFGMVCVTAICLAPFVRAGACCLCFKLGAALLSPLCSDSLRRLLSGIGSGFALLLGMLGASCTILYLELVYAVAMVKPI